MADTRPFRGIRYDLGRAGALSKLIAPPYDVIPPELQEQLYTRSDYNAIRLELSKSQPGDDDSTNRYTRAAASLREWLGEGILAQDSARNLYVYEQEFEVDGQRHHRRGFFARVRLEPFGEGQIFPHEETMSGPKEDRLKLYRATQMNISPIFGLYPDQQNEVFTPLEPLLHRVLPLEATDDLGVINRFWPIAEPEVIEQVTRAMGSRPIFIADGHHRYETGLNYLNEKKQAGEVANDDVAANFIMMMLVGMSDPGLQILPTHRLIGNLPENLSADDVERSLASHFEIERIGTGDDAARETWELIQADGTQSLLGFGTARDNVWQLARFTQPQAMEEAAPEHSAAWRELAVSVLHVLVLDSLLPQALNSSQSHTCRYVHQLEEVTTALGAKEHGLGVLVPPATMTHVELIAGNHEKMPPKSTYFYPKVLTGLVFNSLKGN